MASRIPPRTARAAGPPQRRRRLELLPQELRRSLDPATLGFATTAEVAPLRGTIGQPRALHALEVGLDVATAGFNVFVAGAPGSGRRSTVLDCVGSLAERRPVPDDWVIVHSFDAPDRPKAIRLPAGRGARLAADMEAFVTAARRDIPRAFESEEYARRRREIVAAAGARQEELEAELVRFAGTRGFALRVELTGVVSMPLVDGKPITREGFDELEETRKAAITAAGREVEERTSTYLHRLHQLAKDTEERVGELDREVALFAMGPLLRELGERYHDVPEVLAHLDQVQLQMVAHLDAFRAEGAESGLLGLAGQADMAPFRVNLFVDNGALTGAPVVVERNPTYYNLLGRIEYRASFGAMTTDFREIKAGALHRANGGFLVLDVLDVIRHPFAWDGLKRALRSGELRVENLAEEIAANPTSTPRPEPIPLSVKVVLIGSPAVHGLLQALDDDFPELFKVKAHFAPDLTWSREHHRSYAGFVSRWVAENELMHFDAAAVARLIEHGARLRESQTRLTARLIDISDIVSEASYWAGRADRTIVGADDVERAIAMRIYRSNLIEERLAELVRDGRLVVVTRGHRVGEVNGLSVIDLGDHAFGRPVRISARTSIGRGSITSIEREIELSGPIHSKGVLTLVGYLTGVHGQDRPLALTASLAFEQIYDEVDGDSATLAELLALLSSLADAPLQQGIAVTGSVDQHGSVQAVGGIDHKVEGFFAACRGQGLTGAQGVIVPRANARNLMLSAEVVEAVTAGRFHVWGVRTVDEAIRLTIGLEPGRRRKNGSFPEATLHWRIAAALDRFLAAADPADRSAAVSDGRAD